MTNIRTLVDPNFNQKIEIGPVGQLHAAEIIRILGSTFSGTTIDTSVWTSGTANGGSVAQAGGEISLETNTTANGSATLTSARVARYISGISNCVRAVIQLGDTGTTDNVRRWGAFDANNGAFFRLSGTTLSVVTRKGGVDTAINSDSWNGVAFTLDTNAHTYEIHYTTRKVYFLIDDRTVHELDASASVWSETMHLKMSMENVNSNGSIVDVVMKSRIANIMRFGGGGARPGFAHINSAGTTVLKYGPGTLDRVVVNTTGTTSTFTLYDNTAASGTIIAVIDTDSAIGTLNFDLDFNIGLTVVASATPGDVTIVYE